LYKNVPNSLHIAYHTYLKDVYKFFIPTGLCVLELGCAQGELLASVQPTFGVGIDFSINMLDRARHKYPHLHFIEGDIHNLEHNIKNHFGDCIFDAIIMSDIINDVWDLQEVLSQVYKVCSVQTRIIVNFHSHLWEKPLQMMQRFGTVTPRLTQNWFTPDDVENLADLVGLEQVRRFSGFLWAWNTPILKRLCNSYLCRLWPFSIFNLTLFIILRRVPDYLHNQSVSVIIPAKNEAGNIETAIKRIPMMGNKTELIFVEGNSTDNTWTVIHEMAAKYPERSIQILRQDGKGKGDAVRKGFQAATGDILMILDADLTVPPETLPQFYDAIASGKAEFVNGVRLIYPQESKAMRFANLCANKFFSIAFSWLLERPIKDTLCGTKVISSLNYMHLASNRSYFGEFDPFGDFDLLFGASKLNLQIRDLPVRYRERTYGDTNINRWRDGIILLRMVLFAARRIKFIC
jgi:SAM-dependent methyltransferase